MPSNETPRVYIACLACYNDGTLAGEWIDATDADTIRESITELQAKCGHVDNDWAIHDYDGLPSSFGENPDLDKLAELAQAIEEHGDAFREYIDWVGDEYATVAGFEESYNGEHRSEEDFAQHLAEDIGAIDENASWPNSYIDWERAARDLFCGDYYFANGHVFRSC